VLLGLLNHRFLNDDSLGKILEELVQLDKSTLDLLNVVVTSTHSAENSASSGRAVGLELETILAYVCEERIRIWTYSSLENTLVTPVGVGSLLDFGIGSLGVDNTVLTGDLLTVSALVASLLVAVLLELLLEARLELTDLAVLDVVVATASGSICLEELDLILDGSVENLRLSDDGLESRVGGSVGAVESALMSRGNLGDVLGQLTDVGLCSLDARQEVLVAEDSGGCLLHWGLGSGSDYTRNLVARCGCSLRCAVLRVLSHGRVV
jgi:hypothetical protein